ncbi:YggS family pyridoxal phosphate-dependent enzyme [Chitinophaga nivalis]|uniref:Pyridoxal phosphate homeostasis protein n=1 Tax=Chitinophaga nivalis TaxID=2991709 RepID=A0ABT3IM84_9BACT|nr:YggS family pyridoxal phosphate-dependent enzyme [Chitinophaga nivalis]MCW3465233.1 YggS family pyridoxal phosphate-dependent enzyme [Chitinophaga nivalis]MCW3485075.1 YggS family pyridoxal phosphate-dependent enzyme [Chitinophaga nivalis]
MTTLPAITSGIEQQLAGIQARIRAACIRAGRAPETVQLLLATKTVPPENIRIAVMAGVPLLGENKVQELKQKATALQDLPIAKHFIGHLQSNKVKEVLKYVTCIQSIDSLSIALALDKQLQATDRTLDIMVQVNTSFESSKFGVPPDQAPDFIRALKDFPQLRITGLMTIGLLDAAPEKARPSFRLLRDLRDQVIREQLLPTDTLHLSMGMSNDLEIAIEEGATIVRVGTAIFGKRQYPDSYYWNESQGG